MLIVMVAAMKQAYSIFDGLVYSPGSDVLVIRSKAVTVRRVTYVRT